MAEVIGCNEALVHLFYIYEKLKLKKKKNKQTNKQTRWKRLESRNYDLRQTKLDNLMKKPWCGCEQ